MSSYAVKGNECVWVEVCTDYRGRSYPTNVSGDFYMTVRVTGLCDRPIWSDVLFKLDVCDGTDQWYVTNALFLQGQHISAQWIPNMVLSSVMCLWYC